MERKQLQRQSQWSESLAVGSPDSIETFSRQIAPKAKGWRVLPPGMAAHCGKAKKFLTGHFLRLKMAF
jgi:hypothetical protein